MSGKEAYQEYLKSETWETIRAQRLATDNGECVLCGEGARHVHHRRYPKKWGTETINDLVSLCVRCHAIYHEHEQEKDIDIKDLLRTDRVWIEGDHIVIMVHLTYLYNVYTKLQSGFHWVQHLKQKTWWDKDLENDFWILWEYVEDAQRD